MCVCVCLFVWFSTFKSPATQVELLWISLRPKTPAAARGMNAPLVPAAAPQAAMADRGTLHFTIPKVPSCKIFIFSIEFYLHPFCLLKVDLPVNALFVSIYTPENFTYGEFEVTTSRHHL